LLNALTGAGVLVDDSLFATLDPAVRRARTPSGRWFTLTDTVGFVRHLPHQLVEAFRSTLEEVADADLILHVVDGSDADPRAQISAVREVLGQIGANEVPELVVVNKADEADPLEIRGLRLTERGAVVVSARTGRGLDDLLAAVEAALPRRDAEVSALVPYGRSDLVARAHQEGEVLAVAHCEGGTQLTARVPPDLAAQRAGASNGARGGTKGPSSAGSRAAREPS
jgi:GTP-binding protein HflX